MSARLAGKKALVTAAGQGIGRAVAEALRAKALRSSRPTSTPTRWPSWRA